MRQIANVYKKDDFCTNDWIWSCVYFTNTHPDNYIIIFGTFRLTSKLVKDHQTDADEGQSGGETVIENVPKKLLQTN